MSSGNNSEYALSIKQQPLRARMAGQGEKSDRRPLDPPPVISLRLRRASAQKRKELTDDDYVSPTLTHSLFMFASLVGEHDDKEVYMLDGSRTKHVTGSVVSSLFHLKDQSCFVFPDLSVRTEGRWRFKMSMYEIVEDGVRFCSSITTDVFTVYSSKRFPGMAQSTELSRAFAQQGLRLRIRRPLKNDEENTEPLPEADAPARGRQVSVRSRADVPTPVQSIARTRPRTQQTITPVPSGSRKRLLVDDPPAPRQATRTDPLGPPKYGVPYSHLQQVAHPQSRIPSGSSFPPGGYVAPPPAHARGFSPAPIGVSYPAPSSAFHAPESLPVIPRLYAGQPPAYHGYPQDPAAVRPGLSPAAFPSREASTPSPSAAPHMRERSDSSQHSSSSSRHTTGELAGGAFVPTPSRSPDHPWQRRFQAGPFSPAELARHAESSVRMEEDVEMGKVEPPPRVEQRPPRGSLAMLLGDGATDVKEVEPGPIFFEP